MLEGLITSETAAVILRAVQEALANVHKHSQARRVQVVLRRTEERVFLTITDDGIGFPAGAPPTPASHGGYGLVAMRERVAQLAGELRFEPGPQGGAQVALSLPVHGEVGL